jgi:hypothetical protein
MQRKNRIDPLYAVLRRIAADTLVAHAIVIAARIQITLQGVWIALAGIGTETCR